MPTSFDADILILGAGAAGLAAARVLSKTRRVLVLEARQRVGGRILSHRTVSHPLPIDLGPEFIHGRPPETFALLDEAGLIAVDIPFHHHDATRDVKRAGNQPAKPADDPWEAADEFLSNLDPGKKDCSFKEYIDRHPKLAPAVRARAIGYVEGFNAARYERISVRSIIESNAEEDAQDGERQHHLVGGYDQLTDALARSIGAPSEIRLGVRVCDVKWKKGRVIVTAETAAGRSEFRAPRAIIALPLGVLQAPSSSASYVRFNPELPARDALQNGLCMGHVRKFTLHARTAFWEEKLGLDVSFMHDLNSPIPVWWTQQPLRTRLLTGWAGGSVAEKLPGDLNSLRVCAVNSLSAILKMPEAEVDAQILSLYAHDWSTDPFSLGAYTYVAAGHVNAPDLVAKPSKNTLYFAGEHTHRGLIGTVAGALRTGYRAARAVENPSKR